MYCYTKIRQTNRKNLLNKRTTLKLKNPNKTCDINKNRILQKKNKLLTRFFSIIFEIIITPAVIIIIFKV